MLFLKFFWISPRQRSGIVSPRPNQDILAFENVCILMVDNNAPILFLKMLSSWFSNPNSSKGRKIPNVLDEMGDIDDISIGTPWLQDRPLINELKYFDY
jgi:hypothetical protein